MAKRTVSLVVIEGDRGAGTGSVPPAGGSDGDAEIVFGSDDHLATELVKAMGGNWRCASGQWHLWDRKRWGRDETKKVLALSRRTCRRIAKLIDDKRLRRQITSEHAITAAARLAACDLNVAMQITEFDPDPWKLNTPDGILDLRTGQLGPSRREALMTRMAGAGPGDECPTFMRYLDEATGGDKELQQFLQRVAGYCLTGSTEEQCILFFHGPGGSGKSTFLQVIRDVLGDYAANAPINVFTVALGERHPTELAHFAGARVVTASEIEEGQRWNEARLKAISGSDMITARFMKKDFFDFEPQFKLLIVGNHLPHMRSADDAMRRRLHVVPFRHKPKAVDKNLREKLKAELGGILKWAMEGEIERQRLGGLYPPPVVTHATDEYFRREDTLGRWRDERCDLDINHLSETTLLYRDYESWSHVVSERVISPRAFSEKLETMGFERTHHPTTRRSCFRGLRLRSATTDLPFEDRAAAAPQLSEPARGEPPDDDGDDYPRD
jgi:putative DNA primase/helicase